MDKLFDIYVRDTRDWFESNIAVMDSTYNKVLSLNKLIVDSGVDGELVETLEVIEINISNITSEFVKKYKDLREISVASMSIEDILNSKIEVLEIDNAALKSALNKLRDIDDTDIIDFGDSTNSVVSNSSESLDLVSLSNKLDWLLETFEKHVKSMALSQSMRTVEYKQKNRSGKNSARYIDIDVIELRDKYVSSGCILTNDIYEYYRSKYGVTKNCLMLKLQEDGSWVYKNGGKPNKK